MAGALATEDRGGGLMTLGCPSTSPPSQSAAPLHQNCNTIFVSCSLQSRFSPQKVSHKNVQFVLQNVQGYISLEFFLGFGTFFSFPQFTFIDCVLLCTISKKLYTQKMQPICHTMLRQIVLWAFLGYHIVVKQLPLLMSFHIARDQSYQKMRVSLKAP